MNVLGRQDLRLELFRGELAVQHVTNTDPLVIEKIGNQKVLAQIQARPPGVEVQVASAKLLARLLVIEVRPLGDQVRVSLVFPGWQPPVFDDSQFRRDQHVRDFMGDVVAESSCPGRFLSRVADDPILLKVNRLQKDVVGERRVGESTDHVPGVGEQGEPPTAIGNINARGH